MLVVSALLVVVSVLVEVSLLLLQATNAPAITNTAKNFFIVLLVLVN